MIMDSFGYIDPIFLFNHNISIDFIFEEMQFSKNMTLLNELSKYYPIGNSKSASFNSFQAYPSNFSD